MVDKASAGAAEHMLVSRVTNIPAALDELKKKGLWVYGTAADAPADLWQTKMTGPAALVIGSEGFGMGPPCFGAVRLHRGHPPARQDHIAQRLCGGGDPYV